MNTVRLGQRNLLLLFCICLFVSVLPGAISRSVASTKYTISTSKIAALGWQTFRQSESKKPTREVTAIQYLLRSGGFYKGRISGIFNIKTAKSVRAFQRKNRLQVDGVVASQTFSRLIRSVKRGDRGDAVRALQILLPEQMGRYHSETLPHLKVDGIFGSQTEKGVRQVQRDSINSFHEEPANGVVGPKMWWLLFDGQSVGVS